MEDVLEELEKPVERLDPDGNVVKQYRTGVDACDDIGCLAAELWTHLSGKAPTCKGHVLRFRGAPERPKTASELAELADKLEGAFDKPLD